MKITVWRHSFLRAGSLVWLCLCGLELAGPARADQPEEWFESRIRPVLSGTCFRCHGDQKTGGELRVDSRDALLRGGRSGPALDLENPLDSLLLRAVTREPGVAAMPPDARESPRSDQVADLRRWIEAGAPWPAATPKFVSSRHWAYEPLRQPDLPTVTDKTWVKTSIDAFVRHAQESRGLHSTPEADRRTLLRRATFDLTGLPPTPAEVKAFLEDTSPEAWDRVVERLLASPRYGERWGRLWLDVVRYADTAGETADYPIPTAWRYRNQVIRALNTDLPYDQFAREQIAGDILARQDPGPRYAEQVTATGYLALSRRFGFDSENYHHLTIHDTIDNLGQTFLGLSLGCARCHDHKFDAVSTRDYYALYGIFDSSRYPFPGSEQKPRVRTLASLVPESEAVTRWRDFEQKVSQVSHSLAQQGKPAPNALLRWLGEMDGDFELQAPAAGGSHGVLVSPWMYRGAVAVTTAAQSPYRHIHGPGRVGASVPAGSGPYLVTQAIPEWLIPTDDQTVFLCLDFRLGLATPEQTGRHRFAVTDAAGNACIDIRIGAEGVWWHAPDGERKLADAPLGQWLAFQAQLDHAGEHVVIHLSSPERTLKTAGLAIPPSWSRRFERVVVELVEDALTPSFEWDNFAVRGAPPQPVSTEVAASYPRDPDLDPAHLAIELGRLVGIDGDLELQPTGQAPVNPWNPGPNSVVRLAPEGQSPFRNLYPQGDRGLVLPNRGAYDGFGVTLPLLAAGQDGNLHLAFDFRLGSQAAGGEGSWRYYLGDGPGQSAALELFFNGREFDRRSGDETAIVAPLRGETWYQVRVILDLNSKTYRGELCREGEVLPFEGQLATGWNGKITYSFIDSHGHRPGIRPALMVDNFLLQDEPLRAFDASDLDGSSAKAQSRRERIASIRTRMAEGEQRTEQDRRELEQSLIDGPFPLAYAMSEGTPHSVRLQQRGEPSLPGEEVPRGFPGILGQVSLPMGTPGSGRLELAEWLTRKDNALFARVIVNRVWQHHFGRGLVKTSNDFGVRGQAPTNPELLDHLAESLPREGWSLKALHRLILHSAAWQQQVCPEDAPPPTVEQKDFLASWDRRRLSAEEIRDAILWVTGELDSSVGEAHPFPDPTAFGFSQHAPFAAVYGHNRRSVYLMTQRLKRHPFLALFDGADPNASTPARAQTTVPTQALFFLNDPFLHEASAHWASRLMSMTRDVDHQLNLAWQAALGRLPTPVELQDARDFLGDYRRELDQLRVPAADHLALSACLRLLLGSNEFLHLE